MVPIGRVINPSFNDESKALWDAAKARPFDFDVCCLDE